MPARGGSAFAPPRIPSSQSPRPLEMETSGVLESQPPQQLLPKMLGKIKQAPQVIQKRLERLSFWGPAESIFEGPSVEQVLGIYEPRAIAKPMFGQNVWEQQTGREFVEDPSLVDALVDTGLQVLAQEPEDENPWVEWVSGNDITGDLLYDESIHTWTGTSRIKGFGSEAPWIKTRAIVPFAPTLLVQLLMDSARFKRYHTRHAQRKDLWVNLAGASSTKISRHHIQSPHGGHEEYLSLLHARPVPEGNKKSVDNVNPSWIMVSRAIGGKDWLGASESESKTLSHSQVLLGVNMLEPVPGRPDTTLLTTISHVSHEGGGESAGLSALVEFIKNLRELNSKRKQVPATK